MTILAAALLSLLFQSASIQGTVVKAGGRDPISKVMVELHRADENAFVALDRVTTGDDGRFFFEDVRPGRYRLAASGRGYARPPVNVTVSAGQPSPDVLLSMNASGAIYGRVFAANGLPLANAELQAL